MRKFMEAIAGESSLDFHYGTYDCLFTRQAFETYCLFIFLTDAEQLLKLQEEAGEIFQAIKRSAVYDMNMDKNITCVLCLCVEDDAYYELVSCENISDLSRTICLVEEDLNFFKKNVFLYTKDMRRFARSNTGRLDICCQKYLTENNFQLYKKSPRNSYEYEFLINLFIKIPFLSFFRYQQGDHKEYQTMGSYIEARFRKKEIDAEHIEELCGQLEEHMDGENELFEWLDSLIGREAEE